MSRLRRTRSSAGDFHGRDTGFKGNGAREVCEMSFRNSILIKNTGLKNPPSGGGKIRPQERAEILFGKYGGSQWGKASGLACVDTDLSPTAHRLLSLLAIKAAGKTRQIELGKDDICFAFDCHRDTARVLIAELSAKKYVKVIRRHNNRNIFELCVDLFATKDEIRQVEKTKTIAPGNLTKCNLCNKFKGKITEHGWCFPCATKKSNKARMLKLLRECGDNIPAFEVALVCVKAEQNRGMKSAYLEALKELGK